MSFVPIHKEHVQTLQESAIAVGPLQDVIVDEETGEILVGKHRSYVPNWPVKRVKVKDELHKIQIILAGNVQREIPREETRYYLVKAAKILEAQGVPKDRVCTELCKRKIAPYSERHIRQLLPKEYKMVTEARDQGSAEPLPRISELPLTSDAAQETRDQVETAMQTLGQSTSFNIEPEPAYPFIDCGCAKCVHRMECPNAP